MSRSINTMTFADGSGEANSSVMYTDIASSSLRELDAVALATNVTIFMERGTK